MPTGRITAPVLLTSTISEVSVNLLSLLVIVSMYSVRQSLVVLPKSYVPSTSGIKWLLKSAATVIASVFASPIVILPPIVTLPVTSRSPVTLSVVPSNVKLALSTTAPAAPTNTTLPLVKSLIITLDAVKSVPSNVRFALSSNEPLVPAITTLPLVKSLTVALARVLSPVTPSVPATNVFPVAQSIVNLFKPSPNKKSPVSSICKRCTPSVQKSKSLLLAPGLVSAII